LKTLQSIFKGTWGPSRAVWGEESFGSEGATAPIARFVVCLVGNLALDALFVLPSIFSPEYFLT
jgi:hypothetical protein